MSEKTIWDALRAAGLSEAGAAGLMGNMYCESLLQSNNVEDRCTLSDADYTSAVDSGRMTRSQFCHDSYGYGLCQWTFWSRKEGLYDLAKKKGASVADEAMQCEWCISELLGYPELLNFLKTTGDVYTAASRVCTEFERPAVNNIQQRYNKALEYFNKFLGSPSVATPAPQTPTAQTTEATNRTYCAVFLPILKQGDTGIAVVMAQRALLCFCPELSVSLGESGPNKDGVDGVFGIKMLEVVKAFQKAKTLSQTGIIEKTTWEAMSK